MVKFIQGWEYEKPEDGECCGRCKQTACIIEGELHKPDEIWYSGDNCTTYQCIEREDQVYNFCFVYVSIGC